MEVQSLHKCCMWWHLAGVVRSNLGTKLRVRGSKSAGCSLFTFHRVFCPPNSWTGHEHLNLSCCSCLSRTCFCLRSAVQIHFTQSRPGGHPCRILSVRCRLKSLLCNRALKAVSGSRALVLRCKYLLFCTTSAETQWHFMEIPSFLLFSTSPNYLL